MGTRGTGGGRRRRPAGMAAGRGRRAQPSPAGGTSARTCPSSRSARSAWSRCATTTWRGRASGTPRSSPAGARTAPPRPAPTSSSRSPPASACPRYSIPLKKNSDSERTGVTAVADKKIVVEVAGRSVGVSNPDKVYFPRTGHTKLDLVNYYLAVADGALGGVAGGALGLKTFVNGAGAEPVF